MHRLTVVFLYFFSLPYKTSSVIFCSSLKSKISFSCATILQQNFKVTLKAVREIFVVSKKIIITRTIISTPIQEVFLSIGVQVFVVPILSRDLPAAMFSPFIRRTC